MARRGRPRKVSLKATRIITFSILAVCLLPVALVTLKPSGLLTIAGFIAFVVILIRLSRKLKSNSYRRKRAEMYQYVDIDSIDPIDFEHFCATLLCDNGFQAKVTQASNDKGIDVIAKKDGKTYAIQVKHYQNKVGIKAVQEAYSGRVLWKADYAYVMTNSYYSNQAKNASQELGVGLWDRDSVLQLMRNAGSRYARKMTDTEVDIIERKQMLVQSLQAGRISSQQFMDEVVKINAEVRKLNENSEVSFVEPSPYPKGAYISSKGVYSPGCFTIGQDIPTGRYIFTAIDDEQGRIEVYKSYDDYMNDETPQIYNFNDEQRLILHDNGSFISVDNAETKLVSER